MVRNVNYANRGKGLQFLIDMTNRQYKNKGQADIREVPTPVQITSNVRGKITGYTKKGEWVDYIGIGDGRLIAFDAKETKVDNFPLKNLHAHQYELLESWWQKGGTCFLIIQFTHRHEEIYLLPFEQLRPYWEGFIGTGRKSIPYAHFVEHCDRVKSRNGIVLDYLWTLRKDV